MPLKLHYFQSENFGDALSPKLVAKLSGQLVIHADPYKADIVAIGSVLYSGHWLFRDAAHNKTFRGAISYRILNMRTRRIPIKIWGSGFLSYPKFPPRIDIIRAAEVYALRGKVSHQILEKLGLCSQASNIPYGDPGLLYFMLLDSLPPKEYDIGIIPHYFDQKKGAEIFNAIRHYGYKTLLIDVLDQDPLNTIKKIAKCKTILSSSLHGCIVADSLGISNRQMMLSMFDLTKNNYLLKYRDYYSAFGMALPQPLEASDILGNVTGLVSKIEHDYCVPHEAVEEVQKNLLKVFPYVK